MRSSAPPRAEGPLSRRARYQWAGRIAALMIRLWGRTLRMEWNLPGSVRALEEAGRPLLYAFWHAHILTLAYAYREHGVVVLVSQHKDGEYISQIIHRLGFGTVRGSSTRGGLPALLEMARIGQAGSSLAVTPDGPRGPRHTLQPGLLPIAQRSRLPIVPIAAAARSCRYLRSWDRFELPRPFSRVLVAAGEPIEVPAEISQEDLKAQWGPRVEEALRALEDRATAWAGAEKKLSAAAPRPESTPGGGRR